MHPSSSYLSLILLAGFGCSQPQETTQTVEADTTDSKFAHAPLVEHI